MEDKQWLSIVEYARQFSVSDMTVRRRIRNGKLHAELREGKYFIPVAKDLKSGEWRHSQEEDKRPTVFQIPKKPAGEEIVKSRPVHIHEEKKSSQATQTSSLNWPTQLPEEPSIEMKKMLSTTAINKEPLVTVEAQKLLEFCQGVVKKFSTFEGHLKEKYRNQVQALEAKLTSKNVEVQSLNQQLEDLQTLVKFLEQK